MPELELEIVCEHREFLHYTHRILDRLQQLGPAESERRLGMSLDQLASLTDWIEVVPAKNSGRISLQPSVRFDEVLAALA